MLVFRCSRTRNREKDLVSRGEGRVSACRRGGPAKDGASRGGRDCRIFTEEAYKSGIRETGIAGPDMKQPRQEWGGVFPAQDPALGEDKA